MAGASGPVHYIYLRAAVAGKSDNSASWPPPKEQAGADDEVAAAVQLVAGENGWLVTALDHVPTIEEIPDGALVLTRDSELGFTLGRPDSAVSVTGARVEEDVERHTVLLTHLVVSPTEAEGGARRGSRSLVVPADRVVVTNYEEHGGRTQAALDLRMAAGDLHQFPQWMPDATILPLALDAVDRAVLSPRARHGITLEVNAGRVSMHGRVEIASTADAARSELEQTPGLVDVANYLLIDESLQDIVEQALMDKGIPGVRALAEHGLISLHGEAPDSATRFKAQDVAARVTGVRGVVNRIEVRQQI